MLRRRIRAGRPGDSPPCPAHYSGARKARIHPRPGPQRESPIVPGEAVLRAGLKFCGRPGPPSGPDRVRTLHGTGQGPPRSIAYRVLAPPRRLAFLSRLSYWCDIRWAWIWAMKSITTTTTISSEVPPK